MPFYFPLRHNFNEEERQRAARRLVALRRQLREEVPARTLTDTLLLATWNIRDFDSNKFGHGPRLKESFFYIAEVLAAFDLIAVQEVNEDLSALQTVMRILWPRLGLHRHRPDGRPLGQPGAHGLRLRPAQGEL